MKSVKSPRLVAVVELEPTSYAKEQRDCPSVGPSSEHPEPWGKYWNECLADSGIDGLVPIAPGSWFVSVEELVRNESLTAVLNCELDTIGIPGFPDDDERWSATSLNECRHCLGATPSLTRKSFLFRQDAAAISATLLSGTMPYRYHQRNLRTSGLVIHRSTCAPSATILRSKKGKRMMVGHS